MILTRDVFTEPHLDADENLILYIAGSGKERQQAKGFMQAAKSYGYTIAHDWASNPLWDLPDDQITDQELIESALEDLQAVDRAHILWYVTPNAMSGKSEGSTGELCAAVAARKLVIVSGPLDRSRIFPRLAQLRFRRHSDALECLRLRAWNPIELQIVTGTLHSGCMLIKRDDLEGQEAAKKLHKEWRVELTARENGDLEVRRPW